MLEAQIRQPKTKLNQLRRQGKLPAVVYGHGFESVSILLDRNKFIKEIKRCGQGSLLDLQINGSQKPFKVILQDTQKDPVGGEFIHIDLYRIRMDKKLTTQISINFVGYAPAVKSGGILVKSRDYLEVECLPQNLVSEIEVDLSSLKDVHDSIRVSDITVPSGIDILDDKDLTLANIAAPVEEKEEEASKEEEKEAIDALEEKEGDKTEQTKDQNQALEEKKDEQKTENLR